MILNKIWGLENENKYNQHVFQEITQFYNVFGSGVRKDVTICSTCNNEWEVIADFTKMILYFPEIYHNPSTNQVKKTDSIYVTQMMHKFILNMEVPDRDCEACNIRLTTTQQVSIIETHPKMLILYIQRQMIDPYDQSNLAVFINLRVQFSMTNFRPTSNLDNEGQNIVYNLFATINHHPTKESGNKNLGHYTVQCKYPNTN